MINFIICDDNKASASALSVWIEKYINTNSLGAKILLCTSQAKNVLAFLKNNNAAIYKNDLNFFLLDINLNEEGINGITLAEIIKTEYDPTAKIIFITAYAHCIGDAINHCAEPFGYLIKPVKENVMESYMQKIERAYKIHLSTMQKAMDSDHETVQLKSKSKLYNIRLNDVVYIETISGKDGYIQINTCLGEKITLKYSLYKIIEEFNQLKSSFFQCYQSYVININYVHHVDKQKQQVLLKDTNGNFYEIMLSRKKNIQNELCSMLSCKK